MVQIVKSLLKNQGIDIIGLFDKEKDIWIYVKDEEVHFCKSDLSTLTRKEIGQKQDFIILTESENTFRIVEENEQFSNFIACDANNKVLAQARLHNDYFYSDNRQERVSFSLIKITNNISLITTNKHYEQCNLNKTKLPSLIPICRDHRDSTKRSYFFIENSYLQNCRLCSFYKDFYIFSDSSKNIISVLKKGTGVFINDVNVEGYGRAFVWIHEDGNAQVVFMGNDYRLPDDNKVSGNNPAEKNRECGIVRTWELGNHYVDHVYKSIDYIVPSTLDYKDSLFNTEYIRYPLVTNHHILLPYSNGMGALVIQYKNQDSFSIISAYSISFTDNMGCNCAFENSSFFSYKFSLNSSIIRIEETEEVYEYSIDGEPITHDRTFFYFFDIRGNIIKVNYKSSNKYLIFETSNDLYLPERFNSIKGVMNNWNNDVVIPPIYKDIISVDDDKGLFELTLSNETGGEIHQTKGLYSVDEGFIIPFGSEYDIIDYVSSPEKMIKKYVVYSQGNKKGVICNGKKLFNADFEYISKGCYIKNHSYFLAGKEGKEFIISDDSNFYEYRNTEYDSIFISNSIIEDNRFFIVEKEEKVGAICTNKEYNIPLIFDSITLIINSGVLCHHNVLFDRSGNEILSIGDGYNYIRTSNLDVFKSKTSEEFIFIDKRGDKLNYQRDEDDDNIIHVDGIAEPFDIEKGDFIEDEGEYNDYGPEYTQQELDEMYCAAFEGDPEAEWNID